MSDFAPMPVALKQGAQDFLGKGENYNKFVKVAKVVLELLKTLPFSMSASKAEPSPKLLSPCLLLEAANVDLKTGVEGGQIE
jgi:hypothetical protein